MMKILNKQDVEHRWRAYWSFLTRWMFSMSMTMGTAAITRSLSTAAVVQAEEIDLVKNCRPVSTYLPSHALRFKERKTRIRGWIRFKTYFRSTGNQECFWNCDTQLLSKLLHSIHGTNRSLHDREEDDQSLQSMICLTLVMGKRRRTYGSSGFSRNVFHVHAIMASSPRLRLVRSA